MINHVIVNARCRQLLCSASCRYYGARTHRILTNSRLTKTTRQRTRQDGIASSRPSWLVCGPLCKIVP